MLPICITEIKGCPNIVLRITGPVAAPLSLRPYLPTYAPVWRQVPTYSRVRDRRQFVGSKVGICRKQVRRRLSGCWPPPDAVTDNWFRSRRPIHDLVEVLGERGMPLPETKSLYHGIDTTLAEEAFTGWCERRHGTAPDPGAVGAVAEEWLKGALLGTWHAASPHRAAYQLSLISDGKPDHPVTVAAKALLPEWVRWNGEQAGLPEHLIDRAAAAAAGAGPPSDCAVRSL